MERSEGRRYPELPHPYRTDFQRDRDRIVHARAFRRLEDKTQVFTPSLSDHFRNRLTHTIEVAQIARTVASVLSLNETLTEVLALAHDIGHPPFAHSGEEELNRQMNRFGESFDHNVHALRIVEAFEQRYARFPGLNLTFEVREGIVKHSRDFEPGESSRLDEYKPGLRPPLEAQIIDLADEVAYNSADLDDGFSANMFTVEQLVREIPHFEEIQETVATQFAGATERVQFLEALRMLIDWLVTGLIEGTLLASQGTELTDAEAVRNHRTRLAGFTKPTLETNLALKSFLRRNVYFTEPLITERNRSAQAIAELFQFLLKHPDRLPAPMLGSDVPLYRVICDYIAGMTDGYFRRIYSELIGVPHD